MNEDKANVSHGEDIEGLNARPVKSFFVHMLTRDIKLEEAVLDLLDNCVDGVLRRLSPTALRRKKPYKNKKAEIEFDGTYFKISDNCGGIPWELHDYAFRMGRPDDQQNTIQGSVGVYGIGMKRAIFKMGKECKVLTQFNKKAYEVEITPDWIKAEDKWTLPYKFVETDLDEDGTIIEISNLYDGIKETFSTNSADFEKDLRDMIATHYAFIIEKGFEVTLNGSLVIPRPTQLVYSDKPATRTAPSIRPFIFKGTYGGVQVFLSVGFTRPLPTDEEIEEKKFSSKDAGWTVVCNDRAVLYRDQTELTGWGEANIPQYHTQFIAISGIVEFQADDPSQLPTTTTKRGIDATSALYLRIKNKMREGMKIFIDYTNDWRGRVSESKTHITGEKLLSLNELKQAADKLRLESTRKTTLPGKQFKPVLPTPPKKPSDNVKIAFTKSRKAVKALGGYLLENEDARPSEVGEAAFDLIYKKVR